MKLGPDNGRLSTYKVYQNDQLCAKVTVVASDNTALFETQTTASSLGIRIESAGDVEIPDSKITGLEISGIPSTTSPVTFKAKAAADSGTISYRYSIHPDYGTSGYDGKHWSLMGSSEWATDNILNYTFPSEGKYIIVVWATTADTTHTIDSTGIPIVGWSVDVSDTMCKTNFTGLTVTGDQKVNQQMTFTVNGADSCDSTLNYRFSMHSDYGTSSYDGKNWQLMTDTEWGSSNSINYTFTKAGKYIVVVWISDTSENVDSTGIPIIGWSVDIE